VFQTRKIRLLLIAVAITGLWLAETQGPPPDSLAFERVADDLYVTIGNGGNVAIYVTPEGVILVDDQFERNLPTIQDRARQLTAQPIRYVINTHHHGDHTGGNTRLLQSAEIICHRNARARMMAARQPGPPRVTFAYDSSIHLGGKEVRALYYGRGHTGGDVVVYFPELKVLHTGDLFVNTVPLVDYASGASALEWISVLHGILRELDVETIIPGHGPIYRRADLEMFLKSFEIVRERLTELKKTGRTAEQALQEVQLEDLLTPWRSRTGMQRFVTGMFGEIVLE
jgi:glyoxylase-like metal-dependent hydrolase (beta-lactamase superfamily II)